MVFTSASLSRNISGKFSRKFKNGLERPWKASQGPLRHWECSGRLQNLIFRFLWCSTHCNRVLESAGNFGKIFGKKFPEIFRGLSPGYHDLEEYCLHPSCGVSSEPGRRARQFFSVFQPFQPHLVPGNPVNRVATASENELF